MRSEEISDFLKRSGWGNAVRTSLSGDASARRYERLVLGPDTALLMDVPPDSGLATGPYLEVANWLSRESFSAPDIYAADPQVGLLLIEDLGDGLFLRLASQKPGKEREIYAAAIDLLAEMQRRNPPGHAGGWKPPHYDMRTLMREVGLLPEWYLGPIVGEGAGSNRDREFADLCHRAFEAIPDSRQTIVYRDYHAENLIWLPERRGHRKVGLIDFQDMLIGDPSYDVVSLLDDARRDVSPGLRLEMTDRYLERSGLNRDRFLHAACCLSAQRNLKILGLFARLCLRDGKPRYLSMMPRVWDHLVRNLEHPEMSDLSHWVHANVPEPVPEIQAVFAEASDAA